jgi:HD superfamily phosphohydrolase
VTRIRDPIHNYIHLDAMGQDLVDMPRVQRLRRIHQLGTGALVYPGANHTRFEHSLGAYHLAGLAARHLGLDDEERKRVQAAALLHDIGHGPFSHTADPLYRDFLGKTHEDVSVELIEKGAFHETLRRHGVASTDVVELVRGRGRLGRLVSGDLDVDRLDYLVRDSHYTGVNIGVDLERLVSDIVLTGEGVALREGSVPAAEMVLVTRLQMYATVYHHRTLRVAERMIERAFRLALDAGEIKPEQLPSMDDVAATMLLRHSKTDAWRLMLAVDQRKLYKVALEERMDEFREDAVERLSSDGAAQARLEAELAQALGLSAQEVILDVPEPPVLPEVDARILTAAGDVLGLADVSLLVRSLGPAQRDHWRLRVVVPASRRADAAPVAGRILHRELA